VAPSALRPGVTRSARDRAFQAPPGRVTEDEGMNYGAEAREPTARPGACVSSEAKVRECVCAGSRGPRTSLRQWVNEFFDWLANNELVLLWAMNRWPWTQRISWLRQRPSVLGAERSR
jgi:hypothetical protein